MDETDASGGTKRRRWIVAGALTLIVAAWALLPRDDAPPPDVAAATNGSRPPIATRDVARTTKDGRPIVLVMVVAKSGGAPIEGAEVVGGSTVSTDARGVAAVAVPEDTDVDVVVRAKGYGDARRRIGVDSGDVIVALARDEPPGKVAVRVTSPTPQDVRISVDDGEVATGAAAAFERVPPGHREVTASGGGPESGWEISREVDVASGCGVDVDVEFDAAPRIVGRVVDVEGRGVAGCIVAFTSWSETPFIHRMSWGRTDAGGAFAVEGLSADPGTLQVGLSKGPATTHVLHEDGTWTAVSGRRCVEWDPTYQVQRGEIMVAVRDLGGVAYLPVNFPDVSPGAPAVRATLHRAARLVGRLKNAPAVGGRLVLSAVADQTSGVSATFDARGEFGSAAPVVGEALRLWLLVEGFAPTAVDAPAVETDETRDLGDIALSKGSAFDVAVVDADGAPCLCRRFDLLAPWPHCEADATDGDGHVRYDHLPQGRLRIAFAATRSSPRAVLVIDDAASAPATFVIGRGATVAGRVVGANGRPAAGVEVSFHLAVLDGDEKEDASGRVTTQPDGSFELPLQAGRLRVGVAEGIRRLDVVPAEITVVDGGEQRLDLRER